MRSSLAGWCVRSPAAMILACAMTGSLSAQDYTSEVIGRLHALPGIPATYYNHVATTGEAIGDGYGTATGSIPHAMYMAPGASAPVDLHPAGYFDSYGLGGESGQQVGYGWSNADRLYRALLWHGSAASVVILHPPAYLFSRASATDGIQQVGSAIPASGGGQAVVWEGTAESVIALHPVGYRESSATGVGDGQQVGVAFLESAPTLSRAMVWSGTAESAVDLHAAPFIQTFAFDAGGGKQVGQAKMGSSTSFAVMWSGTPESMVNLNPAGATHSIAYATNGEVQVGDCSLGGAAAWRGSAESFINLHALLPVGGSWSGSRATSIDDDGVIYGRAYGTHAGVTGWYAVKWIPEAACVAKYNGDDDVDILDFLDFMDDFSVCEGEPAPCGSFGESDINGDTLVDILDFLDFLDSFGTGC